MLLLDLSTIQRLVLLPDVLTHWGPSFTLTSLAFKLYGLMHRLDLSSPRGPELHLLGPYCLWLGVVWASGDEKTWRGRAASCGRVKSCDGCRGTGSATAELQEVRLRPL